MSKPPLILNREQVRQVDRRAIDEYGMSGLVLMENAGRGVADKLCQLGIAGPVIIACGKGNNAGDGFVIARHLDLRGNTVRVLVFGEPKKLSEDARANYEILAKTDVPIEVFAAEVAPERLRRALDRAVWVVDALLGTGAVGPPRPPLDEVIDAINASPARKLAVDLPSGLDCDTGAISPHTIRAHHTCTFVAAKPGFFAPGADAVTGIVHVLDIGAPRKLVASFSPVASFQSPVASKKTTD